MSASLKGKVILVTGATSGIGKATALAAAKAGAHVVLTGRRAAEGESAAAEARKSGAKAVFVQGDVSKDEDNRRFVAEALKLGGRLDGAFNNAGIEGDLFKPTHEQSEQNYQNVFDINVKGVLLGMKHQVQAMLTTGGGAIVNNASIAGSIGFPGMSVYVASKHAVVGLSRAAALEYAKQGIRVNIVSPAAIKTEMYDRFTGGEGTDFDKQMAAMHPVGRAGTAAEIAAAVLFLLSPEASFITGHNMQVDGGFTAQ